MSAGTGMFVSHAAHVKGWRSRSPAGTCRLYFLSRATKSTKKCPSCDLCRANGGRGRLKSRGTPAVESIHSQRPVPGASISLREDDAGPCGLRRCEAIKVCRPGTHRRWDARGRAYRAGQFTCPSEYLMKGVPDANQRSVCGGAAISLREDDAGPCDLRRRGEYGQTDVEGHAKHGCLPALASLLRLVRS